MFFASMVACAILHLNNINQGTRSFLTKYIFIYYVHALAATSLSSIMFPLRTFILEMQGHIETFVIVFSDCYL
jgi:hypothetical protein